MKIEDTIVYYIGYNDFDGFWCSFETSDLTLVKEKLNKFRINNPNLQWIVYKKTTSITKENL